MIKIRTLFAIAAITAQTFAAPKVPFKKAPQPSALDKYIEEAHRHASNLAPDSPGSLWSGPAALTDISADLRASRLDDLVTILVNEQASAVATGTTKTQRQSSASASITAAGGQLNAAGALANLAQTTGNQQLDGEGTTSRQTTLSTTLAARVTDVLPNGYLVIEGSKTVLVNSENQTVTVRGVVRPIDLTNGNVVLSDNIAEMELKINGRGVVNDAIHRPNILYRILLGLLPF